jgi:glycosyltransferase involved in cell wall biosynthesis
MQEAMARGLPIVSTLHAGIPEAVTDGVHGFLVPEGDTAGMAARILQLANDRTLTVRLGHAGWLKALAEYTYHAERQRLLSAMGIPLLTDIPGKRASTDAVEHASAAS